jgi:outer membrane receptor for ferrienterochelin and colicin
VSQFNAAQANAQAQFNAGEANAMEKFNSEMQNQRDQFNAKNRLVIDQNNATWRREIATADTTAINRANELNATALLNMSNSAYNNLWQYYSDVMEMSWESTENERNRVVEMAMAQLNADSNKELSEMKADYDSAVGFGSLIGTFLTAGKDIRRRILI